MIGLIITYYFLFLGGGGGVIFCNNTFPAAITLQSQRRYKFCFSADANKSKLLRSFGVDIDKYMNK